MRRSLHIIFSLIFLSGLQASAGAAAPTSRVYHQPYRPEPGGYVSFSYHNDYLDTSATVQMTSFHFLDNRITLRRSQMAYESGQWNFPLLTSSENLLLIYFEVNGMKDSSMQGGYVVPFYMGEDTLATALRSLGTLYSSQYPVLRQKPDTALAIAYMERYFNRMPAEYIHSSERMLLNRLKKDTAALIRELEATTRGWGKPESEYREAYIAAQELGSEELSKEIARKIRGFLHDFHYPYQDYKKIEASENWEENLIMLTAFRRKHKRVMRNSEYFQQLVTFSRLRAYYNLGRYSNACMEVEQMPPNLQADLYCAIVETIVKDKNRLYYDVAEDALKKAIPMMEKQIEMFSRKFFLARFSQNEKEELEERTANARNLLEKLENKKEP